MIKWEDEYCVGVKKIDEQHKELFRIAKRGQELLFLPQHSDKYDDIVSIIEELRAYTKFHFDYEEKLMMSINYSKLFTHKVEHQDFIDKIYEIDLAQMDEEQNTYLITIVDFITTWIIDHIKTRDMLLAKEYQLKKQPEIN